MDNALIDDALVGDVATRKTQGKHQRIRELLKKPEWMWTLVVCVVLGVSGGLRYLRDWQFQSLNKEKEKPPFPLKEFPKTLGDWREVEGTEITLDPQVARIAGSTDHLTRTYVNEKNGERVSVMILYGLAYLVWPHTPNACYPAAGFKSVPPSRDVEIDVPETTIKARFREQNFAKYQTGAGIYQQVYYSLRNAGEWGLNLESRWKSFRYHPGMFKVQVQRQVVAVGKTENISLEEFLGKIVQEIEQRLAAKK
jgi:Protein of unknown function (DUF3485)